jgi:hypothetical protein
MNKQIIEMKKYGKFLHGREEGSFAFRKLREEVLGSPETVFVFNFDDVLVLAPSYCDEVFANLHLEFPNRIKIASSITHAHRVAFETIEETRGIKFGYE